MKVIFVGDNKKWFAKLGVATALVLIGIVIGIAVVFAIAIRNQPTPGELETIRLQHTIDYIETEQVRLGIKCADLRTSVQEFLDKDVGPILDARRPGRYWNGDINERVHKRMEAIRDYYLACGRLYREAQLAGWDGFKGIEFAVELDRDIILMDQLIAIDFCEGSDTTCLDENFRKLRDAVTRVATRIGQTNK